MSMQDVSPPEGGQGTTPPVSPPAAPPSPPAAPPPPPAFHASFESPDDRGYAEVKGWKSNAELLKSYRNLETMRGVPPERLVTLPENMEDAEAMKPVLAKLGLAAPEKPEDYGFDAMDGVDPEFAKTAQGWMHELGVPPKMATALAGKWNEFANTQREGLINEAKEEAAAELGQLAGEWGSKYNQKMEQGRQFARRAGFSAEAIAAIESNLGVGETFKTFANAFEALGLGEADFVIGAKKTDQFNGMSPDAAKAEHKRLMSDGEFMGKYLKGDIASREKMQRLNRIIAGDQSAGGA